MNLLENLLHCANLWSEATGRSLGALGTLVMNHGAFFERIESKPRGPSTETLERFARFWIDGANWPDGAVPDAATAFFTRVLEAPREVAA